MKKITILILGIFLLIGCSKNDQYRPGLDIKKVTIHPEISYKEILKIFDEAKETIDIKIYSCTDTTIVDVLEKAIKKGVYVRMIVSDTPNNRKLKPVFESKNIHVRFERKRFKVIEEKEIIIDANTATPTAMIMTFNLDKDFFTKTRDFGVVFKSKPAIREMEQVFNVDWGEKIFIKPSFPGLVWSPSNAREIIFSFLRGAQKSIDIYGVFLDDLQMIDVLIHAEQKGVKIRGLYSFVSDAFKGFYLDYQPNANGLKKAASKGLDIRILKRPIIHARAIIIDDNRLFIGSQDLSPLSLDVHAGLGLITNEKIAVDPILKTFNKDWKQAIPFKKIY